MKRKVICPHCGSQEIVPEYQCVNCKRTFGSGTNGATAHCEAVVFVVGGYFEGYKEIKFEKRDSYVDITAGQSLYELEKFPLKGRITLEEWKSITNRLFHELFLLSWEEGYSDPHVLDGTQWEVTIEFDDRKPYEIYESNDFPPLYGDFLDVVNPYFKQFGMEEEYD